MIKCKNFRCESMNEDGMCVEDGDISPCITDCIYHSDCRCCNADCNEEPDEEGIIYR